MVERHVMSQRGLERTRGGGLREATRHKTDGRARGVVCVNLERGLCPIQLVDRGWPGRGKSMTAPGRSARGCIEYGGGRVEELRMQGRG